MNWELVHTECPSGEITIEAWLATEDQPGHLIFIRNHQGLMFRVYSCAEDAVEDNTDFALADVCYGWYNLLWEKRGKSAHNDFLSDCDTRSEYFSGIEHQFTCHESSVECEDAYHAAAVVLGNEECAGCERCEANA